MRAKWQHTEAYLAFSLYFSLLRNFPLSKWAVFFCPQMAWKGFSQDDQARICVTPYYRMISNQWGKVRPRVAIPHCSSHRGWSGMVFISAHGWSLEDILIFSCFIFLPVATTHEILVLESIRLAPISWPFVNAVFSIQNVLPLTSSTLFQGVLPLPSRW